MDIQIKKRIEWFTNQYINDFSPTISPAPKSISGKEIESIRKGVNYFLNQNITKIVVQKKYMGSYCSIYLKRNLQETYFVSRNGHIITHIDLEEAKNSLKPLHQKMLERYPYFDTLIIASELLPWSILGGNLISREYEGYYDALQTHINHLKGSNLYDKIKQIKESEVYCKYIEDQKIMEAKDFKKRYPSHVIRQYEAIADFKIIDLEEQQKALKIFKEQVETFGKKESLYFKPFTLLKIINENGTEQLPNSNLTYQEINEDAFLHLHFTENNYEENIQLIYDFFEKLSSENEEGIMIKPEKNYIKGIPPCFKVRNNNYLTMIYGIRLQEDYDYHLHKRNIKKKLEQSINDWEINQQMLQIPYKNLNRENYLMKLLLLKRINNEEIEKNLDPRL